MPGRVSVTDSHHGDHHDLGYAVHDGLYAQYEPQYGHYDPNVTGSVFEDSGEMVTPLPGSLGSPGPHQPPHQAPRAVFDEDEQEPPPQAASNMFLNRQQPDTLTGWFDFFLFTFSFFTSSLWHEVLSSSDHPFLEEDLGLITTSQDYLLQPRWVQIKWLKVLLGNCTTASRES